MSTENQNTELWAVHAQGPDDIYPAYDRADAERHAAELNALPAPPGISVAAVVIPSPLDPLAHWQGVAEQEREHKLHLLVGVAPTDANLSAMRREGLSIDGDNTYKRDLLDAVVGALAFGKMRSTPPPAGHWLERFYEIGKAEADERDAQRGYMASANLLTTKPARAHLAGLIMAKEALNPMLAFGPAWKFGDKLEEMIAESKADAAQQLPAGIDSEGGSHD